MSDRKIRSYKHLILDEWELTMATSISDKCPDIQGCENALKALIEEAETVWVLGWLFRDYTFEYLSQFNKDVNFEKYHKT